MGDALEQGRQAYARRAWEDAYDLLHRSEAAQPLAADDLERLAFAAALTGRDDVALSVLERWFQAEADAHRCLRAARAAFWLGFRWLSLGEVGQAGGWLARAQRLVDREDGPCAERGYLMIPSIVRQMMAEDYEGARSTAQAALEIAEQLGDADLDAFVRQLEGRVCIRQGRVEEGLALLDEVMITAATGELSPLMRGLTYCSVIATCDQVFALARAREWTQTLARWCASEPQSVTFNGRCMVHRAHLLELVGQWSDAAEEARRACERLARTRDSGTLADGHYQQAEVMRLRGELERAEAEYRRAHELGREPQPGLSLLRLAQGERDAAAASIRRVLASTKLPLPRARFLPACVEILLACNHVAAAREAADELAAIADAFDTEILAAMAAHADGAVRLAEGDAAGSVEPLRHALGVWHQVGAPYIVARIRVLLARACASQGDHDGARMERDASRRVFEELDATSDLAGLDDDSKQPSRSAGEHGLTRRELEVLQCLARGETNRAIAKQLGISERTIDRHVSNLFGKLGVASRSAATAFAYEHGLV